MFKGFSILSPLVRSVSATVRRPAASISTRQFSNYSPRFGLFSSPVSSRSLFQQQKKEILAFRQASRPYSSKPVRDEGPKFRYIVLLVVLATIGFVYAEKSVRKPKPGTMSIEEYEAHKKKAHILYKKTAFARDDALVIFVLGGPGVGKGTQCANLVRDYNFVHLSAGDLLREEQDREGSEYGELIKSYIRDGKIVPQEVTVALLRNAMKKAIVKRLEEDPEAHAREGPVRFLIDGFPRQMDQALKFEDEVSVSRFVLYFECPEEVMLKRLLKRGETSGRSDDNIESIKKRFRTFVETSMPVVEYFDKSGKVYKISCEQPVDVVYSQVKTVLQDRLGLY